RGSLIGSGTNCESGAAGRDIVLRNYGERVMGHKESAGALDTLTSVTRPMATIQRVGNLLFDNANIALTGARDISNLDGLTTLYGIYQVDTTLMVCNGSSIVLGNADNPTNIIPADIDSVKVVRSVKLKESVYNKFFLRKLAYTWIGVRDVLDTPITTNANMYYSDGTAGALSREAENVILFQGRSKLFVRYHIRNENQYGELQGFFRMSSPFKPHDSESFAYARQKVTGASAPTKDNINTADGGFLSYHAPYNYYTDNGDDYTKTNQYPYINVVFDMNPDLFDCRGWYVPTFTGQPYYVDGTGKWGKDGTNSDSWGRFPDKPKKTINGGTQSIMQDNTVPSDIFDASEDVIYAVGPVSGMEELAGIVAPGTTGQLNHTPAKQLRVYRYPGGHKLSNGEYDHGGGTPPTPAANPSYNGLGTGVTAGPGAYYGPMLVLDDDMDASKTLVMDNVLLDGLYGISHNPDEMTQHEVNTHVAGAFSETGSNAPLVEVKKGTLVLKGNHTQPGTEILTNGTILQRGYNNWDANTFTITQDAHDYSFTNYFTNPDFTGTVSITAGEPSVTTNYTIYNGGGLYVAPDDAAVVKVEGLVTIEGNKQKKGDGTIESNVYLPTFSKSLTLSGALTTGSYIGVTSPIRNTDASYLNNTFSPVAVAETSGIASTVWSQNYFHDDLSWFFTRDDKNTYFYGDEGTSLNPNALYFGWTWANVVRTEPEGFNYSNIDSEEDLAWLISKSAGMNGATATDFEGVTIQQIRDLDMNQYVWVPLGDDDHPFKGIYDGKGHTINNLIVKYLGKRDLRYKRSDYGMFGRVVGGKIKRTFVVGGSIHPEVLPSNSREDDYGTYNIGGLVGYLEGDNAVISNSEAAVNIVCPNYTYAHDVVAGGLVGEMKSGQVHSSMAMPEINVGKFVTGPVGGLVGKTSSGSSGSSISNSFVNAKFSVLDSSSGNNTIGGLMGFNGVNATVNNCYVAVHGCESLTSSNFGSLAIKNDSPSSNMTNCYVMQDHYVMGNDTDFKFIIQDENYSHCSEYTPTMSSDVYGYMYEDNKIQLGAEKDTAMFIALNRWVVGNSGHGYARWARPGLSEINGDLPVLLLDDTSAEDIASTDDFRSLATYNKGVALQYGGTARDGNDKHLSTMLTRDEYVFVYGDVDGHDDTSDFNGDDALADVTIEADKVSIYEHASIKYPGKLSELDETYVGITFDNSCGQATSTPGINYGLNWLSMGPYNLPRDWHMFSSPLRAAPLGFDYKDDNVNGGPSNNPWNSSSGEFSWLQSGGSSNIRYWMKGWENSQSQNGHLTDATGSGWVDGYFPSRVANAGNNVTGFEFSAGCITESYAQEAGLYPYGMDFYTWTEPDYHWINFKRNGPNHWKSDGEHEQIDYEPVHGATKKQNEDNLIVGRGYMASIGVETFMQSHGMLNADNQSINLTYTTSSKLPGWNLVGNPFHGYLDFNKVAANTDNANALDHHMHGTTDEGAFYVVYNADAYDKISGVPSTAFRYYPVNGSKGGEYAERYLHPHQGFYVMAKQNPASPLVGELTFTQDMLVPRDVVNLGGHFRDDRPAYPLVNLYLSSDKGCADVTVIEFERPEWGGATKLKDLRVGNGSFYAHHDHEYYAACFAQEGTDRVPLWFEAKEDDIFTIKWNIANGDFHSMYLIDNITGIQYDMLRNDTYTFEGHKNDYWSRFLIVFNVTDVDENLDNDLFVFFDGSEWVVTGEGELEFVDVLGHVLMHTHVNDGQSRVRLPKVASGVYLMRLTNGEKCRVQKVIVNNK
nr:T9SS type A sorting domain-containing protein [Bacteroidales bacterium]